jgi:protocatechuate 3,4-dioxygenase beta subunit
MRPTTRVVSIVVASAALLGSPTFTVHAGQTPAVPTTISGRVFAADTSEPLVNARVTLTGPNDFHAIALTGIDDGGFTFASVPAGVYRLSAVKPGYVRAEFGASGFGVAGALPVDGRPLGDIEIRLARGAAVSGRVFDSRVEPLTGQTVTAAWGGDEYGRGATAIAATRTDDLGEYRLGGLPAGAIRIYRGGLPQPPLIPDRPIGRAVEPWLVILDTGEERSGIDFALPQNPMLQHSLAARSGTGIAIRGRVVSDDGRPLYRAQVMLLPVDETPVSRVFTGDFNPLNQPTPLRSTFTDEIGQYELGGISPGRYRVGARESGYVPMGFDEPRSSAVGRAIAIDANSVNGVDIALPRLGAIAGRITDETGNAIEGAIVTVLDARFEDGRRVLVQPVGISARPSDDRGQYRVFGIEPGRYFVRAGPGDPGGLRFGLATGSEIPGYAPSFFPGVPAATLATRVDVAPSSSVTGVDFPLVRTATATVSGRVLTSDQEFHGRLEISPRSQGELVATGGSGAVIYPDGRFEFRNVAPGDYVISSYRGRNGSTEGEFGAAIVTVGAENVSGVSLITSTGSTLRGHVVFDGAPSPSAREIVISTMPTDLDLAPKGGELASTNPAPDGAFALGGVSGTRRLRIVRLPAGWALKSITLNGVDVTDAQLPFGTAAQSIDNVEVLLTNRLTRISGEVTDVSGRRVSSAAVVACAVDRQRWYPASRFVRYAASADGTFTIQGLPAGEYYLVAVGRSKDLDAGAWQDQATLGELALRATRISLDDEQRLAHNLQISSR